MKDDNVNASQQLEDIIKEKVATRLKRVLDAEEEQ